MTDTLHTSDRQATRAPSETRFEALFEHAPVSMQLLAPDGRTLRVNQAWQRLWQVGEDDGVKQYVLGGEYNILTDPQLAAKGVTPLLRRAFAGEHVEIPAVLYDPAEIGQVGRARWVKARAYPIRDAAGLVSEVMLIHEDETDRHESELALQESEQRLRLATDAARIGIWDWDIDRDVVSWTPEVYALHGLAPGAFGGTAEAFAKCVHPEDAATVWERISQAVESETGFSAEFRVVLPQGGDRWLSTSSRAYRGRDGGKRMVGATFSVDAYKRAEEALRESDRRKDEFLAMLAHELRNPLAPIRSAAEILLLAGDDAARRQRAAEVIARQVTHVTKLVDDLLDVSRVTRGLVAIQKERVELKGVLESALEQAMPLIESRRHVVEKFVEAAPVAVVGDRARLVQVLVNLLNNAARYTPPGGRISLRLSVQDGKASMAVTDNGQGIEAPLLRTIFDLFTQGPQPSDRGAGGLGIGLALVKRIVALHGGHVEAVSPGAGKGSTFIVTMPLCETAPRDAAGGRVRGHQAKPGATIMVVDDNRDAADSLAALLELAGHTVFVHYDAAGALASAEAATAQAFLLDLGLPDMDGRQLRRLLQQRNPDALYAVMSGFGQPSDLEQSRQAGFSHHLVKPVEWDELARVLDCIP